MTDLRLGVDIGGTFTDFVLFDQRENRLIAGKQLTTPSDPRQAVLEGTRDLLAAQAVAPTDLRQVIHGTTLVANTLIERKGAHTALITTEGFRDVLEIGREIRYDLYDLFIDRPEPLVPRYLRLGVRERVAHDGTEHTALATEHLQEIGTELARHGVTAVAVSLLNAHRNPAHEQAIRAFFAERFPAIDVSISTDVAPEIREYERTSTTVANAYVRQRVRQYLLQLDEDLRRLGMPGSLLIMLSNGGLVSVTHAAAVPIQLVESGPAAGALAARYYGGRVGHANVVAFDMGGTTAKICLVEDGKLLRSNDAEVARLQRFKRGSGFPLKVPTIDLIEIGAGGGSIAYVDRMGLLKVGPESSGAVPGPAAYGRGGADVTVSDADLLLGYLNPEYFLGGEMRLDVDAARAALGRLANTLHTEPLAAAAGIFDVVNENMAAAARLHIAERGRDPRHFALVATGGAGPVHAYRLACLLGIRRVIYPLAAGTMSALGFLLAPPAVDLVRSFFTRLGTANWEAVNRLLIELEQEARRRLVDTGADMNSLDIHRSADMRYIGQGYEISVPLPHGPLSAERGAQVLEAFHAAYRKLFGRHLEDIAVELLNFRVSVRGAAPRVEPHFAVPHRSNRSASKGRRPVYFPDKRAFIDTLVYDRYALQPGTEFTGPAVIEERESTVVVGLAAHCRVDQDLTLIADIGRGLAKDQTSTS